jgi:GTP-binding protein LepA
MSGLERSTCSAPVSPVTVTVTGAGFPLGGTVLVRVIDGKIRKGMKMKMVSTDATYIVDTVGVFTPKKVAVDELSAGEVGFINAAIKTVSDCKIGDTITEDKKECLENLPGFKPSQSVVFCGLFPVEAAEFEVLRDSLAKLQLNDSSFEFQIESSAALGLGYRCGFLGMLHLEIIQERLDREFGIEMITTAPSVIYKLYMNDGTEQELHSPADMPDPSRIKKIEEPWMEATILTPDEYLGSILALCTEKRGVQKTLNYVGTRAMVVYRLPLGEVVFDFYDRLKSCTKGYASFDYTLDGFEEADVVKLSILVNAEPVDALSIIVHRSNAEARGRILCERLKDLIPRQMFQIPIQAAIGGKIIARETISAMRKDVTAKCYGGDITRKKKLLEKQKKGKKKMRTFGSVEIPQSAFIAALKVGDN